MKVVKNINNNVAICLDSNDHEVVVFAKGIGFKKPPYEVSIKEIQRTFYDVDSRYLEMIQTADEKIIDIAADVKHYTDEKNIVTSSNLLFSLIDHITFAIQRSKNGIYFNLPISHDIQYLYKDELEIGKHALKLIEKKLHCKLPKEEASYIAMNIINSETEVSNKQISEDFTINKISEIIENELSFKINKDTVSYSRFESHMRYLLKTRVFGQDTRYSELLDTVREKYPEDYKCAVIVTEYLNKHSYGPLTDDETLFLAMHINKLRLREKNTYK